MSTLIELIGAAEAFVERGFLFLQSQCAADGKAVAGAGPRPAAVKLDGAKLDALQVPSYDLALCAAELAASSAVQAYATEARQEDRFAGDLADCFTAEVLLSVTSRLTQRADDFGLPIGELLATHPGQYAEVMALHSGARQAALGATLIARDGRLPLAHLTGEQELMRETFNRFAADIVAPRAQSIHRDDSDIPEDIIEQAAELGLFGVSIPERFGGLQPNERSDTVAMLVVTEALSAASLGAAGSLITRPEIMARALLAGGTAEQQSAWLPRLASGECLVAISITEPDFGSDVAGLRLRATRCERGWRLNGAKTWCTFAGRAEVILVVARTHSDMSLGHRGLSQFLVPKPRFAGHSFEHVSPGGGKLTAKAINTIGYRGMHSFDLFFEDFIVADDALVGGAAGEGRGFYFTMTGMSGGRVQTSARANGVMQAALNTGLHYARSRRVFGQPIANYPLSQARLGRMAAWLTASRQLSYRVGRLMDGGAGDHEASLVKLFACRAAEWVTRDAMQLHGGLGYAEETLASRLFVDARVLSIFEGAEETLALKVIARERIAAANSDLAGRA